MIPLRDTIPSRRVPLVNYGLIVANLAVFVYSATLPSESQQAAFMRARGLVPGAFRVADVFTSMFLHASVLHLAGNMLYLYIFGDNVEDRLGHVRYICFYLLCGVTAATAQLIVAAGSELPMVGASGAIAGVAGAYFLFFPRSRVLTLVPVFFCVQVVRIPAVVFLGFWFLLQFLHGSTALAAGGQRVGGVAWWAHVGGFVGGMVLGPLMRERRGPGRTRRSRWRK